MSPEVWIAGGVLALGAAQFAYQVWRDKKRDRRHGEGEPPTPTAA